MCKKIKKLWKKTLTFWDTNVIIRLQSRETKTSTRQVQKGTEMDEELSLGEMLREVTEENQTRKILEILNSCKDLNEAKEKVKALLNK